MHQHCYGWWNCSINYQNKQHKNTFSPVCVIPSKNNTKSTSKNIYTQRIWIQFLSSLKILSSPNTHTLKDNNKPLCELNKAVTVEHKLPKQTLISSIRASPPTPFHTYPGGGNGMHRDIDPKDLNLKAINTLYHNHKHPKTIVLHNRNIKRKSKPLCLFESPPCSFPFSCSCTLSFLGCFCLNCEQDPLT